MIIIPETTGTDMWHNLIMLPRELYFHMNMSCRHLSLCDSRLSLGFYYYC